MTLTARGLPYPEPTAPVAAGANDIKALAAAVDPHFGKVFQSLPALPASGYLDFQAIPQTHTHLRLVLRTRSPVAANFGTLAMRCNSYATAGGYYELTTQTVSSTVIGFGTLDGTRTDAMIGIHPAASAVAGWFGVTIVDLPFYTLTGSPHIFTCQSWALASAGAGNTIIRTGGCAFTQGVAITSLQIMESGGSQLAAGSQGVLYGVP